MAVFASLPREIDTAPVCALLPGRTLFPRVVGDVLHFHAASLHDLQPGRFGIREPPVARGDAPGDTPDLVLVPGLLFTAQGARLGRGAGYYDRTLAALAALPGAPRIPRIGVCYAQQLAPELPTEAHDLWMDWVVTDTAVYECTRHEASR